METALWDSISEPAKDLIQRMLTTDVNHRITIQEVLNHRWLRVSRAATYSFICINAAGYGCDGDDDDDESGEIPALICIIIIVFAWAPRSVTSNVVLHVTPRLDP